MIPKKIHYCWFGGRPIPDAVKHYMSTWHEAFPDFEIKQWDETNFDVSARLYTRQAYYAKRYAFVSDVARLLALTTEGGLYFDTDILVKRRFPEEWFDLDAFASFEHDKYIQTGVMACKANHPIFEEFLKIYDNIPFFKGLKYDLTTNVARFTEIMHKYGFSMDNTHQTMDNFELFPQIVLCAKDIWSGRYDTEETYAVHDFGGSWGDDSFKPKYYVRARILHTILKWHLIEKHKC